MSSNDENDNVNMLKEKIKIQDLGVGAIFEVDTDNFDEALESAKEKESYNEKHLEDNLDRLTMSMINEEDLTELRGAPGSIPFSTIAKQMTDVYPFYGSKLKKRVLRMGEGPVVPATAFVSVHYTAYVEYADEPFDSTYLRNQIHKFIPNDGDCVPGLNLGIVTMRKKEVSQFLIHPELGFGAMGVPPRIPKDAELLYEVEILDFIDGVEGIKAADKSGDAKEEITALKKANAKYLEGNEHFKSRNYTEAIVKYRKALSLIEIAEHDDGDEKERLALIVKLCTNLALCHTKTREFTRAIKMSRRVLEMKPNHCKALFYLGKSLRMISEFDAAQVELLKAHKLEPTNIDINKEILQLENKMKTYNAKSKQMTERMFTDNKPKTNDDSEEVIEHSKWKKYLTSFANNDSDTSLSLPASIPTDEMENLKTDASHLGLIVDTSIGDKIIIKKKKNF